MARTGHNLDVFTAVREPYNFDTKSFSNTFNLTVWRNGQEVYRSHIYGALHFMDQNPGRPVKGRLEAACLTW